MGKKHLKTEAVHALIEEKDGMRWDYVFYRVLGIPFLVTKESKEGDFQAMYVDKQDKGSREFIKGVFDQYTNMKGMKK